MSEETSPEVASVAARILWAPPAMGAVTKHVYNELLREAKVVAGSALTQRELPGTDLILSPAVAAQMAGEPLPAPGDNPVEANFEFYIDGWTMKSTATVGEVQATSPEGRVAIIPSQSLVSFLERRL